MLNSGFKIGERKHKQSSSNLARNLTLGRLDHRLELILFPLICMLASWMALSQTTQVNVWVMAGILMVPVAITSLFRPDLGLLCVTAFGFLLPGLESLTGAIPVKIGFSLLILVNVAGTLFYMNKHDVAAHWSHGLSIAIGAWILFNSFLLVRQFSEGGFDGMGVLTGLEQAVLPGLLFWVGLYAMEDLKRIRMFTHMLLGLGVVVALYGLLQEFTGLGTQDATRFFADPTLYQSYFVNGKLRMVSLFSSPSVFGLAMASMSVFAYINLLGPWKKNYLAAYLVSLPILLSAMVLSRTTSAYVLIGIGLVLFLMLSLKQNIVWGLSGLLLVAIGFFILYSHSNLVPGIHSPAEALFAGFGLEPIYQYILDHPLGGGLVLNPAELAEIGGISQDMLLKSGGYTHMGLTQGWIGLTFFIVLLGLILTVGIQGYLKARDIRVRNTFLVYLISVGIWMIGHYYHPVLSQLPLSLVLFVSAAILIKLGHIEHTSARTQG